MSHRATLRLRFASRDEAERLAAALAPENDGFLTTRVEGETLVAEADAPSAASLLRTLDETLACLAAAEKAARVAR